MFVIFFLVIRFFISYLASFSFRFLENSLFSLSLIIPFVAYVFYNIFIFLLFSSFLYAFIIYFFTFVHLVLFNSYLFLYINLLLHLRVYVLP